MQKPTYHLFVCNSFRVGGDPQGVCNRKDAVSLLQMLEEEIADRGLDAMVSSTGCLKNARKDRWSWFTLKAGGIPKSMQDKLDQILDALEQGEPVEELLAV